jgi:hypothetical protein
VSVFDGKGGVLCENTMTFNTEHPGWRPQLRYDVAEGDTYDDSGTCSFVLHTVCCFTGGPILAVVSGICVIAWCPTDCLSWSNNMPTFCTLTKNTLHWMSASPCHSLCTKK